MNILNDDDIKLKFLLELPVHIDGIGNLKAPYLTDIVDLTEGIYSMAISSVLFDKKNVEQEGLDEYTNFQILLSIINQDAAYRELFFYALKLHFHTVPRLHPEGFIYFGELNEDSFLTEEKFDYIKKLVMIANHIPEKSEEDEYTLGNDRARKFMEKLKKQRAEVEKVKKQKINLHSIISAVGWKSQSFDFISKLNIYQLYEGYNRLRFIDNYEYTMQGIYGGNIDGSKIKLADIDWANIIK
jgi:hypothetical protein